VPVRAKSRPPTLRGREIRVFHVRASTRVYCPARCAHVRLAADPVGRFVPQLVTNALPLPRNGSQARTGVRTPMHPSEFGYTWERMHGTTWPCPRGMQTNGGRERCIPKSMGARGRDHTGSAPSRRWAQRGRNAREPLHPSMGACWKERTATMRPAMGRPSSYRRSACIPCMVARLERRHGSEVFPVQWRASKATRGKAMHPSMSACLEGLPGTRFPSIGRHRDQAGKILSSAHGSGFD